VLTLCPQLEIFGKHFLPYGYVPLHPSRSARSQKSEWLASTCLRSVTPLQFKKLLDKAKWVDVPEGYVRVPIEFMNDQQISDLGLGAHFL
jgi:hypothetical protein